MIRSKNEYGRERERERGGGKGTVYEEQEWREYRCEHKGGIRGYQETGRGGRTDMRRGKMLEGNYTVC